MSSLASAAASNQMSPNNVTLAKHRPAGFAAGKNCFRKFWHFSNLGHPLTLTLMATEHRSTAETPRTYNFRFEHNSAKKARKELLHSKGHLLKFQQTVILFGLTWQHPCGQQLLLHLRARFPGECRAGASWRATPPPPPPPAPVAAVRRPSSPRVASLIGREGRWILHLGPHM